MSCMNALKSGGDITCRLGGTWGSKGKRGYPVRLVLKVDILKRDDVYCLSICGELKILKSKRLGLIPIECCGQCLSSARRCLAENNLRCETLNKIIPIWQRYHLNDLRAGSPAQQEFLRAYRHKHPKAYFDYDVAVRILEENGLLDDKSYLYHGKPYRYGTAWLKEEIPMNVLTKLCSILDSDVKIERIKDE